MDYPKHIKTHLILSWLSFSILTTAIVYDLSLKLNVIQITELKEKKIAEHAAKHSIPVKDPADNLDEEDYKEITCLAQNMYFEARNQTDEGLLAVGFVTLNRTKEDKFSKTICGVIHEAEFYPKRNKKGIDIPIKNKCQFSWYCDGKKDVIVDTDTWNHVYDLAFHLYLYQDTMKDITGGATYYNTKNIKRKPEIGAIKTVLIKDHVFYKVEG